MNGVLIVHTGAVIQWATATPWQKFKAVAFVVIFVLMILGIVLYAATFGTPIPAV